MCAKMKLDIESERSEHNYEKKNSNIFIGLVFIKC